jgi:Protein of unknown function (DUF1573)
MKRFPTFIAMIALGFTSALTAARADSLAWSVTSVQAAAKPGQHVVNVSFAFQNTGKGPVTLVSIEPSCHCVSAQSDKATYAPGEKGRIDAAMTVTGQSGVEEKSILVTSDEPNTVPTRLSLRVEIPAP